MTFDVDHSVLGRGIYLSEAVVVGDEEVSTIDVRLRVPYVDEVMTNVQMHSLEHLLASLLSKALEKHSLSKIYWGPMGCQTGFYLLVKSDLSVIDLSDRVAKALVETVEEILGNSRKIPFSDQKECGNNKSLLTNSRQLDDLLLILLTISQSVVAEGDFNKYTYLD